MAKNLVIVESPAKGKTIEKFLGPDYKVVASMGHIRDLPEKNLGIDIANNFAPNYEITESKKKTVSDLQKLAKTSAEVFIATDEDREGEAIGWHLCAALNLDATKTKRIVFHEITKKAIDAAIAHPRTLDINLVDAQQARRILDRLVGYKVSPVLWKKIRKGLSAGRVQSVAVKLIVEKEREINNFKATESWKISVELTSGKFKFRAALAKIDGKTKVFKSREEVEKFIAVLFNDLNFKEEKNKKGAVILKKEASLDFRLNSLDKKEVKRSPQPPFTTSTLQQEAARKFGYGVKQTMMIAQKLYEGVELGAGAREGLITYMRTDSVNLSDLARGDAKKVVEELYGKEFHNERNFKTKSAGAQEAHEAIRPVNLARKPESLTGILEPREQKLYELIWKRTLASQMADALVEITTMDFSPFGHDNQNWITKGEVIKFEGFMRAYTEGSDDETDDEENFKLPNLDKGAVLESTDFVSEQTFSRPPARYTEASLVKKLETEGIGRPSTYAPTISTIIDRGYIDKFDKKYLIPTDIAYTVNDFLEEYFKTMMNYDFTKKVEEDFDKVASGDEKYEAMLQNFWGNTLEKELEKAGAEAEKVIEKVGEVCPECGKDLHYKYSKGGKFIGCSGYPECKYLRNIDNGQSEKLDALRQKYEGKPCPDGIEGTIVVKTGRFGPFLASSEYPAVKRIGKIKDEKEELLESILNEKGLLIDLETGEELVLKNSRSGQFLAAKNYPAVKIAKKIPKDVWDELKKRTEAKEDAENEKEEI
ncbi:MAG: type I DNA topoisomerase [Candidatus Gracilibacteria bacterium]|nr:type I DNA topoisomerase [Candidatus Gracilibacteria bacterium]